MTPAPTPAETYEQYMVPVLFAPWASRLLELADPQPGEQVLDVACGTGIVARGAAPRVGPTGTTGGLDLNPAMLAVARRVADNDGLAIAWHAGRAEALPFPDQRFDVVMCQFGVMFFTDRAAALAEMHRVLRADGRVALSVWQGLDRHPFYRRLHTVIAQRLGMSSVGDIFALGDADALRSLLTGAGFRRVEIQPLTMTARFPAPDAFVAGEIAVDAAAIPAMQQLDAAAREAITTSIAEAMAPALAEVTEGDEVVLPFHAHLALATR